MTKQISLHWKALLLIVVIIAIALFFTFSFLSPKGMFSGVQNDLKEAQPPEESPYQTLDGTKVELKQYRGKPLLINSWATWAPFAQIEFPILNSIATEYGDILHVVAIDRKENTAVIKAFLTTQNLNSNIDVLVDPSDHFYKSIGGYAMPETILYDEDGVIVWHKRGVLNEEELRASLTKVLP